MKNKKILKQQLRYLTKRELIETILEEEELIYTQRKLLKLRSKLIKVLEEIKSQYFENMTTPSNN